MSPTSQTIWDYSGIVATAYDSFFGAEPHFDQPYFTRRCRENAGLALELCSGTGRLLLPLLRDYDATDITGRLVAAGFCEICEQQAHTESGAAATERQRVVSARRPKILN